MLAQQKSTDTVKVIPSFSNKRSSSTEEIRRRKRLIQDRLLNYREKHGLGSIMQLARAARVNDTTIYLAMDSMPLSFEIWQRIEKGLDKLEETSGKTDT